MSVQGADLPDRRELDPATCPDSRLYVCWACDRSAAGADSRKCWVVVGWSRQSCSNAIPCAPCYIAVSRWRCTFLHRSTQNAEERAIAELSIWRRQTVGPRGTESRFQRGRAFGGEIAGEAAYLDIGSCFCSHESIATTAFVPVSLRVLRASAVRIVFEKVLQKEYPFVPI
jgi:hypothetical protein